MLIYSSNNTDTPYIIKSSWTGTENQTWSAPEPNIYFDSTWFYAGNKIVLSCDVEINNMLPAYGHTLDKFTWNGGGTDTNGTKYWGGYSNGVPLRGYSLLTSTQMAANNKYHFSKELLLTDAAILYVKNNGILYQDLSWRLDFANSGTIIISNLLLQTKSDLKCSLGDNGNFTAPSFVEGESKYKFYNDGVYLNEICEV